MQAAYSHLTLLTFTASATIKDVIDEVVLRNIPRTPVTGPGDIVPLKDRDFSGAVHMIENNVSSNLAGSKSKPNFHMLVSGGAPGIGKTRFGEELFNHLKQHWVPPSPWTSTNTHLEYLHMDFGNGIQLEKEDKDLTPTVIIGLRIAYCFFVEGKYDMKFAVFRRLIKGASIQ